MCVHTVCSYICVKLFLYMHSDTMNTTHQESIKMTPYEAVFGQKARSETTPDIGPGLFFVGDSMDDVIPIIDRSVSVARLRYCSLLQGGFMH